MQRVGDDPTASATRRAYRRLKPGPGKSAREVRADQRTRIRRAMAELVAEVGYANVTMRALTRLAGVSAETFYAQFDGKEECLVDTYAAAAAQLSERLAATRLSMLERPRQLERFVTRLLLELSADPHSGRLMLIEAHAGGPAALRAIRDGEAELARALRCALDRRGDRVPPALARWLVAGITHVARERTLAGATSLLAIAEPLARWSRNCLQGLGPFPEPSQASTSGRPSSEVTDALRVGAVANDRDVVLLTVLRLARDGGYWGLSVRRIREAAGLSAPRFKREFRSAEECYLAALGLLSHYYFEAEGDRAIEWAERLHLEICLLCERVAADPELASLLFADILAPGLQGLHRRRVMIAEQTDRCCENQDAVPASQWLALSASTAGLWALIRHELEAGRGGRIPETAPTFSLLLLAPTVGVDAAVSTAAAKDKKHCAAQVDH